MTIGTAHNINLELSNGPTTSVPSSTAIKKASEKDKKVKINQSPDSPPQLEKTNQETDSPTNAIDSILISGMSSAQKKEAGKVFKQLEILFNNNPVEIGIEQQADELLNRVDLILESVFNKLSQTQQDTIALLSKCEELAPSNLEQQLMLFSQQADQIRPNISKKRLTKN